MGVRSALVSASAVLVGLSDANPRLKEHIFQMKNTPTAEEIRANAENATTVVGQKILCDDATSSVEIGGETFSCSGVDFLSFIAIPDLFMEIPEDAPIRDFHSDAADIWGWISPEGKELTLLGMEQGAVVIDSTDAVNPCILAKLPTQRRISYWTDIKTYKDAMYVVKDTFRSIPDDEITGDIAIEVYNLTAFAEMDCTVEGYEIPNVSSLSTVGGHGGSHNVIVNVETGRVYTVGADTDLECAGGLNVFDANADHFNPVFIGCVNEDGYTHDAQCIIYPESAPDAEFHGREICFAYNEQSVVIYDVTEVGSEVGPILISNTSYVNHGYTHQGWLTDDFKYIFTDDELDEECNGPDEIPDFCFDYGIEELNGVKNTSSYVFDVTSLRTPVFVAQKVWGTNSIDHNMYIWGAIHKRGWAGVEATETIDPGFAFLANYMAGLRIVDIHAEDPNEWEEVAHFRICPDESDIQYFGSWSTFMFPNGVVAVSSIERGVFFVEPRNVLLEQEPTEAPVQGPVETPTASPVGSPVESPSSPPSTDAPGTEDPFNNTPFIVILAVICVLIIVVMFIMTRGGKKPAAAEEEIVPQEPAEKSV